jgi:hypothetical protein
MGHISLRVKRCWKLASRYVLLAMNDFSVGVTGVAST